MKKLLSITIAVALCLAITVPALAAAPTVDVTTSAVVGGAGGAPTICAKFETPDIDSVTPGTQVMPIPNIDKPMKFYVIADDPNGISDIWGVDVAVYYTTGPNAGTEKFNAQAQRQADGSWLPTNAATGVRVLSYAAGDMVDMDADGTGETPIVEALNALYASSQLTLGPLMSFGDEDTGLIHDVMNGKQIIVEVTANIGMCQPSQIYEVQVTATDLAGNSSAKLINCFEFLSVVALETDFDVINWGTLNVGAENLVTGDNSMATVGIPTVRNAGNDRAMIQINQAPLTGATYGKQIKNFDALMNQLADADTYGPLAIQHGYTQFNADVDAVIAEGSVPVVLPPCSTAQIDFSVFPAIPTLADTYNGSMVITILHYDDTVVNPPYVVLPTT